MSAGVPSEFKEGAGPGLLWLSIIAPPMAALTQLQANYALVLWACGRGQTWPLHLVTDLLDSLVILALMLVGPIEGKRFVDVSENALYWYFVVALWVPLYVIIYWVPRWM